MSADIIQFVPRADPDREARLNARLILEARAIYESIFPTDTAPAEYVAPDDDSA